MDDEEIARRSKRMISDAAAARVSGRLDEWVDSGDDERDRQIRGVAANYVGALTGSEAMGVVDSEHLDSKLERLFGS